MKISVDWLEEYLDLDVSIPELVETLNRIGLLVEGQEEKDGDVILEVETYSNRPDTLGHLGMAREIAAARGMRLRERNWPLVELAITTADAVDVQIRDEDLCPRYCGLVVKGIRVGPSPAWLQRRIEAMGLNPINNVVDITNFVLFSTSHPIHAFDLAKIEGAKIIIRRARKGEKLVCLDGNEVALPAETLVIADEAKPIALAGVIGGQSSAVSETTQDIFIESAYFDPVSVRLTRKALGIETDASYRFERGADISFPPQAALMAGSLLSQFGGRAAAELVDVYPQPRKKKEVVLRHRRIADLLGVEVEEAFVQKTLEGLEFGVEVQQPGTWRVRVPTFRVDIDREADLVEEVARFYGYENIPSVLPPLKIVEPIIDKKREQLSKVRPVLFHYGFHEVINFSFSDPDKEALLATGIQPVEILNPISMKASLLRTNLLGGLMETAAWNRNRGLEAVQVFETGNIYCRLDKECRENLSLGLLSTGVLEEPNWRRKSRPADLVHVKGACEAVLRQLRYEPFSFERADHPLFEPGSCLALTYKEEKIGYLGLVAKRITDFYSFKQDVYAAEIDLELLFSKQARPFAYVPVAKFPSVSRDVSLIAPRGVAYQEIIKTIERLPLPLLEEVTLVDLFSGGAISSDEASLTFRLTFRHPQRTLLAEEVDRAEQQLLGQLKKALKVRLREGGKIDNGTGKN
ncbi:MAG: phenylalanine--tRNA ligase subunit beta [Acidobacteriota bacterium]